MTTKLSRIIFIFFAACLSIRVFAAGSDLTSEVVSDNITGILNIANLYGNLTSPGDADVSEDASEFRDALGFAPFDFEPPETTNPLCYNSNDGMAWITTITGGTPPFTIEWLNSSGTPIPGEVNDTIFGLGAGNYFCRITDNDGTRRTKPFTINDPPVILYDGIFVDDVICYGADDGAITIEAVGGTGTLNIQLMAD